MSQFSFILSDYSPFYVYTPYANGQGNQTGNGWVQFFSQNGFNSAGGEDGQGDSSHITSLTGATVTLQFFGTDVTLFGTANGTYTISLDGSLQSIGTPAAHQLFSVQGLSNAAHTVTLSYTDNSQDPTVQLAFAGANITSTTQSQSPLQPQIVDNSNTTAITYSGTWSSSSAHQIPEPYHLTKTSGSSASLEFQGRAIAINGMTNFGWWVYQVSLDGLQYSRNASSLFINPNSTLFFQDGLDESNTHTINITNVSDGMDLTVTSFTVYSSNDIHSSTSPTNSSGNATTSTAATTSSGSSTNGGAIAGGVIGGLAFLALVAGLIFWYRKRRNARQSAMPYPHDEMEKSYNRPEIYVAEVDNGSGPNREATQRGRESTSTSPFPMSETTYDSNNSSAWTQSATESPGAAVLTWNPPEGSAIMNTNEKRRPLPHLPEQQEELRPPSHVQSNVNPQQSSVEVDRIADIVMERMANRLGAVQGDEAPPQYE